MQLIILLVCFIWSSESVFEGKLRSYLKKNYKIIGVFLNVIIIYWLKNENILLVFLLISKLNSFFAENKNKL